MKKVILVVLVASVATGAVFATKKAPAKPKPSASYTYYLEGDCDSPVVCDDVYTGPLCSEVYAGIKVYSQPTCQVAYEVFPIGRRPV